MRSTTLAPAISSKSRQRRRTEDLAVAFLVEKLGLAPSDGVHLRQRVRCAPQPNREARKIIAEEIGPRRDIPNVWFEEFNEVTWKLTDGVMSRPAGGLDVPTTRARAWIAGTGWAKDEKRPTGWTAYRKLFFGKDGSLGGDAYDVSPEEADGYTTHSYGPTSLRRAKLAALAMIAGDFPRFVAEGMD